MSDLIQIRRGTSAEWAASNPVLAVAEPGFDRTTGDFKLGDGVNPWSLLPATGGVSGLGTAFSALFLAVPTAWTAVSFQNSWVDFAGGIQGCQYRKVGDIVQVRGAMKSGTIGLTAFTLPSGFRPPATVGFATTSNGAFGQITVDSAGLFVAGIGSNVIVHINVEFSTV